MIEYKDINQLLEQIDNHKNFKLIGGAGSGKTTTLLLLIDELLKVKRKLLVISFTNVAKDEIIERYGKNELMEVKTIHAFIRSFMRKNRTLVNEFLKTEYFDFFGKEFQTKILEGKEFFYKGFGFSGEGVDYEHQLDTGIMYLSNYQIPKVFGKIFAWKPKIFVRLIEENYDAVLIDEFQDTDEEVLKAFSSKNFTSLSVGFFGDPNQRIYENPLTVEINDNATVFYKEGNFRSSQKLVTFFNQFRHDFVQTSLNEELQEFPSKLVVIESDINTKEFINKIEDQEGIKFDAILHLKNEQRMLNLNPEAFIVEKAFVQKETGVSKTSFVKGSALHVKIIFKFFEYVDQVFSEDFWIIEKDEKTGEKIFIKKKTKATIEKILDELKPKIKTMNSINDVEVIVTSILNHPLYKGELGFFLNEYSISELKNPIFKKIEWKVYEDAYKLYKNLDENYTFHSVKGKEFDNVIIYLEHNNWHIFNFNKYFNDNELINEVTKIKMEMLLYVAFTRTKKNLFLVLPEKNTIITSDKIKNFFNIKKI